ncbi:SOS response-associated peptidase [Brachybacterium sp. EE-P12]|uniref:Abasic site processing protein n=1 Tax=Candidatus Brachybacterium intestinipullorum TaxID=2838512 RepID=A0A9D2Q1F1_9MICO|nr:SOS response-associated peptidase [Brachybacterium sp. EE-P12]HJC71062.1 SOS response-associated peptidase [Candidatus Brachybacterium intestinipullorum]
MCGRFVLDYDQAGLLHAYVATKADREGPDWSPVFSIAPSTLVPVVRAHFDDDGGELVRTLEPARWGLRPSWAKEKGPRPINARYETVTTNGMFRGSFTSQRVVVPMTGYYEWVEQKDGTKQPYFVHPNDGGLLNAAGLSAARRSEGGESWDITFTIITREAKDAAGEVHDRMPAYLPSGKLGEWLAPGKPDDDEKADLHQGLGEVSEEIAATLVTHPVSREVNNARKVDRTDPSLIEPIELG